MIGRRVCLAAASAAIVILFQASALAQMPDPRAMSGRPLPVSDLPPGTVTARVIRGQLSNQVPGQSVQLTGAGVSRTATTDGAGRATFTGLTPGARVKVSVTIGAERIESLEFEIPAAGGIRLMLVAAGSTAAPPPADARRAAPESGVPGGVVFGPESRFVVETGDDNLNVFTMMQIVNAGSRAVRTPPLVFVLPPAAVGVGLLEGSTPNAVAASGKVTVNGPFPPGNTVVQFGYSLPLGSDAITIEQNMPAALPQVAVVAQKIGAMQLTSPQLRQQREMSAEGATYIVGQGGGVDAGGTVTLTLRGLPSRAAWPRDLAVALAAVILGVGVWAAARRSGGSGAAPRGDLQGRRERLFAELAALENDRRRGTIDAGAYAARRESLVTALEDLYRGLDREAVA